MTDKPILTFGDGDYSCASCGLGMREPCEHWKKMLSKSEVEKQERGSEMGPCGKHPRMFQEPLRMADNLDEGPQLYTCTLCSDLTAAYERGLRDAAERAWKVYADHEGDGCADVSHIKEEILTLKDRGAK